MALPGFTESPMLPLRGAWVDMDQVQPDLIRGRAFSAQNMRVLPGRVVSRDGHVAGLAVPGRTASLFQWQPTISAVRRNWIFYLSGGKVYYKDLATADAAIELYSTAARSLSYAEAGDKLFIAHSDNSGNGIVGLRIADVTSSIQKYDEAFGGPGQTTPVASELPGGTITAGSHLFGYIVEYRSGRLSPPGPLNPATGAFSPLSYTVSATGKMVLLTISYPLTPPDIAFFHGIMTRRDNPNAWFFVPGATVAVPPNAVSFPVTMMLNMSDEDLANRADSALDYFNLITRGLTGTPPIYPSSVVLFGNRLCLYAGNKCYISDPFKPEYITEARHVVQVPGQKPLIGGGVVGGMLYHFGPNYTYASAPTSDDPRSWPQPDKISESIGVASASAMSFRSTLDMGWIAHRSGLWPFRGQFPDKPTTYLWRTEWRKINWAAAANIVVSEDPDRQLVYVAVPMGAATEPSHVWVVDYSRGEGPYDVDITIDTFAGYNPSSLCLVESANAAKSMWMGPSVAGNLWIQTPGSHDDAAAAIHSLYETGFLLDFYQSVPTQMEFLRMDLCGFGFADLEFYAKDRERMRRLRPVTLEPTPGRLVSRHVNLIGANGTVRVETNEAGSYFELRSVSIDSKPYSAQW